MECFERDWVGSKVSAVGCMKRADWDVGGCWKGLWWSVFIKGYNQGGWGLKLK